MSNNGEGASVGRFSGSDYKMWKFRMECYLKMRQVHGAVTKRVPINPTQKWTKMNDSAVHYILAHLEDSIVEGIRRKNLTARWIFRKLDSIYEKTDPSAQVHIRTRLGSLKLEAGESIQSYLTKFDGMVTDLRSVGAKMSVAEKISYLTQNLPKEYKQEIKILKGQGPLKVSVIKRGLIDKEAELKKEAPDLVEKALSAKVTQTPAQQQSSFRGRSRGRGRGFRGRGGFFGRGIPRGRGGARGRYNSQFHWNSRGGSRGYSHGGQGPNFYRGGRSFNRGGPNYGSQRSFTHRNGQYNETCFYCNEPGHFKRECPKLNQNENGVQEERSAANFASTVIPSADFTFCMMAGDSETCKIGGTDFVLDSGSTVHIINDADLFESQTDLPTPKRVLIAKNDTYIEATKLGTVRITTNNGNLGVIENVLYCKEAPYNLLSVRQLQKKGLRVTFEDDERVTISKNGKVLMQTHVNDNLTVKASVIRARAYICNSKCNFNIWHKRLGHISDDKFNKLIKENMFVDTNLIRKVKSNNDICEACIAGKQARLSSKNSKDKTYINKPLQNLHSDICGPISPPTVDNKSYFMIFVDDYTHYCVTYLATLKSELISVLKDFVNKSQANFNSKVVHLYIDNGREYLSNEAKQFCSQNGITYHLTIPRTPHQNGVAERMIRSITEKARALLEESKLNLEFWGEAVLTATYLINRTPCRVLKSNKTPFEMWHGRKPELKFLRVFGSTVYVHDKTKNSKFDSKTWKGIFVGYVPNGYKVFNTETNVFISARGVIFDEISFLTTRPKIDLPNETEKTNNSDHLRVNVNETRKVIADDSRSDEVIPDWLSSNPEETIPGKSMSEEVIPDKSSSSPDESIPGKSRLE